MKSKYVRYYDVQLELVDHLASAIEEEMESDPNLTFQPALNKVYSKFPITGFNNFIQEKTKSLQWFWGRKFLQFAIGYFRFPKIVLTFSLTVFMFYLSQIVVTTGTLRLNGLSIALILLMIALIVAFLRLPKSFRAAGPDSLLSLTIFKSILVGAIYWPYYMILVNGFAFPDNADWAASSSGQIAAILLSVYGVAVFIITDGIRTDGLNWINEEIYKKYPEYFTKATGLN